MRAPSVRVVLAGLAAAAVFVGGSIATRDGPLGGRRAAETRSEDAGANRPSTFSSAPVPGPTDAWTGTPLSFGSGWRGERVAPHAVDAGRHTRRDEMTRIRIVWLIGVPISGSGTDAVKPGDPLSAVRRRGGR